LSFFAGDLWSHNQEQDAFVVSPMPDVHVLVADASKHRCLILGTDGLWNVMTPLQAVQIVQQTERFNESCYEEVRITSYALSSRS
jgi:protein phosphatase 1D